MKCLSLPLTSNGSYLLDGVQITCTINVNINSHMVNVDAIVVMEVKVSHERKVIERFYNKILGETHKNVFALLSAYDPVLLILHWVIIRKHISSC